MSLAPAADKHIARVQGSLAEVQQQLDEMQAAHKLLEQSLSTAAEQHAKALQQGKQDLEGEKVAHEGTKAKIARHQEALQVSGHAVYAAAPPLHATDMASRHELCSLPVMLTAARIFDLGLRIDTVWSET